MLFRNFLDVKSKIVVLQIFTMTKTLPLPHILAMHNRLLEGDHDLRWTGRIPGFPLALPIGCTSRPSRYSDRHQGCARKPQRKLTIMHAAKLGQQEALLLLGDFWNNSGGSALLTCWARAPANGRARKPQWRRVRQPQFATSKTIVCRRWVLVWPGW